MSGQPSVVQGGAPQLKPVLCSSAPRPGVTIELFRQKSGKGEEKPLGLAAAPTYPPWKQPCLSAGWATAFVSAGDLDLTFPHTKGGTQLTGDFFVQSDRLQQTVSSAPAHGVNLSRDLYHGHSGRDQVLDQGKARMLLYTLCFIPALLWLTLPVLGTQTH